MSDEFAIWFALALIGVMLACLLIASWSAPKPFGDSLIIVDSIEMNTTTTLTGKEHFVK